MARIIGISDIHCAGNRVAELVSSVLVGVDLVLVAGDIECDEPLDLLAETGIKVYGVTGNMDDVYVRRYMEGYGMLLDGRVVKYNGYYLAGIGASMYKEDYRRVMEALGDKPDKPVIVISHYPPYGYNDRVFTGKHIGIKRFLGLIDKYSPVLFLHGHVHEARGVSRRGSTLIVNPGPLMHGYYAVITHEGGGADAVLKRL